MSSRQTAVGQKGSRETTHFFGEGIAKRCESKEVTGQGLQLGGVTEKLGGVTKFNGVTTFLTTLNL